MAITTLFLTGFEHGLLSANGAGLFGTVTGAPTVTTLAALSGSYGLRFTANTQEVTLPAFTASNKVVLRMAFRGTVRPASGVCLLMYVAMPGGSNFLNVQLSASGTVSLSASGTWVGADPPASAVIDTTGRHIIEIQMDMSATTQTFDWKIDGVAQTRATYTGGTIGTITTFSLGGNNAGFVNATVDEDDLIVGSWTVAGTDWYGDGYVIAQLAGSDGTHSTVADFSPGDAGTLYSGTVTIANTMVDDPPGTLGWTTTRSTTDSIGMRVANTAAYMAIAPATTAQTGIANAVRSLLSYSSSTTSANLAACDVRNSAGTVTALLGTTGGTGAAYNVTANNFKGALVTTPAAGWTATEVNAIRWRFGGCTSSDISPVPTVQALMLEVDWRPIFRLALLGVG